MSERRSLVVVALGLVVAVSLLTWAVLGDSDGNTNADAPLLAQINSPSSQHAHRLCRTSALAHGLDPMMIGSMEMSVADLQFAATRLHVSVAP